MNQKANSFRSLIVWQKSLDLAVFIYKITEEFPKSELYGLTNQLRRAVSSISANIAEGYGRAHKAEKIQFLSIANGSLLEVETFCELSYKLKYLTEEHLKIIIEMVNEIGKLIGGFKKSINTNY